MGRTAAHGTRARIGAAEPTGVATAAPGRLHLLSYNIQVGMAATRYRDYLLHSWRYLLPHPQRWDNLGHIAAHLRGYDLVALQESDAGSLRTGFANPTEYLAARAGFPFWYEQVNRQVGRMARHCNALMSRLPPGRVRDYKLPGPPGRGALVAGFGPDASQLGVVVVHLALGRRTRARQLGFLAELVNEYRHAVLMGDLNCDRGDPEFAALLRATDIAPPTTAEETFPAWRPRRRLDHILVTDALSIARSAVPRWPHSDHLPVASEVVLPRDLHLTP